MAEAPQFAEVKFPPLAAEPLDCGAPLGISAQCIVLRHFRELLEQREHAWRAEDVEAVHKLRVAARRTRTALQTFAALWDGREAQRHLQSLGEFADAFNAARDLDVMIIYLSEQLGKADPPRRPALAWLLARNEKLRERQRPVLQRMLRRFEKQRVPEKFVAFFSRHPYDLWPPMHQAPEGAAGPSARPEGATSAEDTPDSTGGAQGRPPSDAPEDQNGPQ